jgi:hypothetical protein
MSDSRIFRFAHNQARQLAAEFCMTAPEGWICKFSEPTRNLEQNAKLWAMLSEVSAQVDWYGQKLTSEEWKDVFSASLKRQKVVPGLDGGFVVCGQRTSQMSKMDFGELIELITAFGAERGVVFGDERIAA